MKKFTYSLAVVIIAFLCLGFCAFAETASTSVVTTITAEAELLSHGDFPSLSPRFSDEVTMQTETREDMLYRLIYDGMLSGSKNINIESIADSNLAPFYWIEDNPLTEDIDESENADNALFIEIFSEVVNRNPNLFYVDRPFGLSIGDDGEIYAVAPSYIYSGAELISAQIEYEGYVNAIASLVPSTYTDFEKILFINDYFAMRFTYDNSLTIFDPYTFFKGDTGVCQSYTLAFIAVMDKLGIESDAATSLPMNHTWNYVKLGDNWYHIDLTWNDPGSTEMYSSAYHDIFLLSDIGLPTVNQNYHDWKQLYVCDDTTYDGIGASLKINTPFAELNGKWYVAKYDSSSFICRLYAFDDPNFTSISFATSAAVIGKWTTSGGVYTSAYSAPVKYENRILFNSPQGIYIFDGTSATLLYTPEIPSGKSIYGFRIKNGEMQLQYCTDPNSYALASYEKVNISDVYMTEIIPQQINDGIAVVPEGVKMIASNAFEGQATISAIRLPNSVQSVESGAFSGADSAVIYLSHTNLPLISSLEDIGVTSYRFLGDLDGSVGITYSDAMRLGAIIAAKSIPAADSVAADLDGDGSVGLSDLRKMIHGFFE